MNWRPVGPLYPGLSFLVVLVTQSSGEGLSPGEGAKTSNSSSWSSWGESLSIWPTGGLHELPLGDRERVKACPSQSCTRVEIIALARRAMTSWAHHDPVFSTAVLDPGKGFVQGSDTEDLPEVWAVEFLFQIGEAGGSRTVCHAITRDPHQCSSPAPTP